MTTLELVILATIAAALVLFRLIDRWYGSGPPPTRKRQGHVPPRPLPPRRPS